MERQVVTATYSTFKNNVIQASFKQLVFVNFWMSWSKPSILLGKNLEQLQADAKEAFLIASVNLGNAPRLVQECKIKKLPTIIAYANGRAMDRHVGDEQVHVLHQFTHQVMVRQRGTGPLLPEQAPTQPKTISAWLSQRLSSR